MHTADDSLLVYICIHTSDHMVVCTFEHEKRGSKTNKHITKGLSATGPGTQARGERVCCNVHHHHLLFLLFLLLFLLLLLRSSALEDSIKQYEQDLARKLYQSRQWAPAPGARPAQMSSAMQSHASRTPGSGSQSRCAQPLPCWLHVCIPTSQRSAPSCGLPGVGRKR